MARTPEQWLPLLAKRIDECRPRVQLLKRYIDGDAPLPEGRENVRESWKRFQKDSRTNLGELIVEAVTDRIVPKGIVVAGDSQSDIAKQAQRIWRDNRMDSVFQEWLRDGLALKRSYLTCWKGDDGRAIITSDSLETMYAAADPLQPWRVRAALRCWRDPDMGSDHALVWSEDAYQNFWRPSMVDAPQGNALTTLVQGKWYPDPEKPDPVFTGKKPPVAVYNNPGGKGEYETHLDVINRINKGVLNRLVIEAMLAFRQRALRRKEGGEPLPKVDANGNEIDWAKILEYAPGALWDLPPGVDIWESGTTDITPLLAGSKDDFRHLSAVTRTPLPMLMPDNTNTSAAGAISTESGYISKCGRRLTEAKLGAEAVLVEALRAEGTEGLEDMTVDLQFEPVEMVSTSEKYQAAQAAKAAGQSVKSIQRDILGWGPDEIRQDALDRADEALRAMALMPQPAQQQQPRPQQMPQPMQRRPVSDSAGNGRPR